MQKPLVSVHYSRLIAREICSREKELKQFLRGTGIDPQSFMHDEILLSTEQQTIIALNAMSLANDQGIGLRMGKLLAPETYGPVGFLVSSSPNLQIAIEHYKTFLPSKIPFAHIDTHLDNEWLYCDLTMRYIDNIDMYHAAVESIAFSLLSIVQSLVGDQVNRLILNCDYPTPSYAKHYQTDYAIEVNFNASRSYLQIPKDLLTINNPIASKANYSLALKQCQAMLNQISTQEASTKNRVKEALLSAPPGTIDELNVARSMFISTRTLTRRLATENTNFRALREELLSSIAAEHLRETSETIESIAILLNYHDSSNFRRAFKKWFGISPNAYRQQIGKS